MLARAAVLLPAISALVSAEPQAILMEKDSPKLKSTTYKYIGWCDPFYERTNATIQYYSKVTCPGNVLTVTFYKDAACTQAYSGEKELGPNGNLLDLRIQTYPMPNLGKNLLMDNSKKDKPFPYFLPIDEFTQYSCVPAPDGLRTEARTVFYMSPNEKEECEEPDLEKTCGFSRETTNYCASYEDKQSGLLMSTKTDGKITYTYYGNTECDGKHSSKDEEEKDACPIDLRDTPCANFGSSDIGGRQMGTAYIKTGLYLNDEGEVKESAAGSIYSGVAPLAMMTAAQLFVGDAPLARAVAVMTALAMCASPANADTPKVHTTELLNAPGYGATRYTPNKRCVGHFRDPSNTERLNEKKYGVVVKYSQTVCEGEGKVVTNTYRHDDPTCEGDVVEKSESRLPIELPKVTSAQVSRCFYDPSSVPTYPLTCDTPPTATAGKAACNSGALAMGSEKVISNSCNQTGCFTYKADTDSTGFSECPGRLGTCNYGYLGYYMDKDCVTQTGTLQHTCSDAPANLGSIVIKAYTDAQCSAPKQCGESDVQATGVCESNGKTSTMITASASGATLAYYSKDDDGSAIDCNAIDLQDIPGFVSSTPVGQCLSSKQFNSSNTFLSETCAYEAYDGETWFKIEYVEGGGESESSATGPSLFSVTSMIAGAASIMQLIM